MCVPIISPPTRICSTGCPATRIGSMSIRREAHKQGFDRPIMQGLCSFGYACRLAVRELIPHAPERMTSMEAQFRSPLFPDTKVELHIWKVQDGLAYFRMLAPEKSRSCWKRAVLCGNSLHKQRRRANLCTAFKR